MSRRFIPPFQGFNLYWGCLPRATVELALLARPCPGLSNVALSGQNLGGLAALRPLRHLLLLPRFDDEVPDFRDEGMGDVSSGLICVSCRSSRVFQPF